MDIGRTPEGRVFIAFDNETSRERRHLASVLGIYCAESERPRFVEADRVEARVAPGSELSDIHLLAEASLRHAAEFTPVES